jgi:hypothetical protein
MAHLLGLLIFVALIAAQIAVVVTVHRNERAREREVAGRDPAHGHFA